MKRWISCFLILLLCITALPASAAEASAPSAWAESEVREAISAGLVPEEELSEDNILPEAFDPRVADAVSQAVKELI